jgi:hypothetical protein
MLTPLALRVISRIRCLNRSSDFGAIVPLDVRTSRKAEPEELPFLRPCHRTLRLIYLELELLCDEARDALHHPLTRAFAANVNVTVVRIANKAVSAMLQLAVEFVEHEITCVAASNIGELLPV